ncbi:MAG: seg [Parcubacteria group bacterium]|nr:seg [Parcubacteria group bacterium]
MKRSTLITAAAFVASGVAISIPLLAFADDQFVPLTQLPGLSTVAANAISLPSFINNLYRISIGLAAFFAIAQIIWAGFIFMGSADSVSKNTKARAKIMNAILGLVLVLSPFVVFSVINPKILNISLNFTGLQSKNGTGGDVQVTPLTNGSTVPNADKTGGVYGMSSCSPACTGTDVCSNSTCISSTQNQNQCQYKTITNSPTTTMCPSGEGVIPQSCCNANPALGQVVGYQCCGKN